ncbi:uncharacterized protein LOC143465334 [Clavelina lepadiformis]|uniref:uncharacterized protein LOC143465334 n=1 Tax=Clavelina lepadiformis TaxID=159417 RepID=UPI004041B514
MMDEETDNVVDLPLHHIKYDYCETRPRYRRGKKKTSVRVFTVNLESKYLVVNGLPATGLQKELINLFNTFGTVVQCSEIKDYPKEEFTQVYLLQFKEIQAAKCAKKKIDERYFFGAMLHVFYAPEYETVDDTREKILHRRQSVISRVKFLKRQVAEKNSKQSGKRQSASTKTKNNITAHDRAKITTSKPASEIQTKNTLNNNSRSINSHYPPTHSCNIGSIPTNALGVPLFLPPPPPPQLYFYRTPQTLHQPRFKNKIHNVHGAIKHKCSTNRSDSLAVPLRSAAKQSTALNSKPKLKAKSGYFYQKVMHALSVPQTTNTEIKNGSTCSSTIANSRKRKLPPVETPSFLPRHIELKQIEQINKLETDADGNIPLLGSFVLEKCPRTTSS